MTPLRSDLMVLVNELSERYPHWRLGQLLSNIAGWADVNLWDVEDDQLFAAAKTHLDHLAAREQVPSSV